MCVWFLCMFEFLAVIMERISFLLLKKSLPFSFIVTLALLLLGKSNTILTKSFIVTIKKDWSVKIKELHRLTTLIRLIPNSYVASPFIISTHLEMLLLYAWNMKRHYRASKRGKICCTRGLWEVIPLKNYHCLVFLKTKVKDGINLFKPTIFLPSRLDKLFCSVGKTNRRTT